MRIIDRPEQAAAALSPVRLRILRALAEPSGGSAASVAARIGLPRQQVNYHLRELEHAGLLNEIDQRRKGNCIERIVRATASTYVISPEVLGALGNPPTAGDAVDRFSSSHLIAACANSIREVAVLRRRADAVRKQLATLTIQANVRFRAAADQNAFAEELSQAVAQLVAKYHDDNSPRGRLYRVMLAAHPAVTKTEEDAARDTQLPATTRKRSGRAKKRKGTHHDR